jgi:hypothetical protein
MREAPMLLLLVVLALDVLFNRLYLSFFHFPLDALQDVTEGLVEPLLSLSFLKNIFILAGLVFWIGRFQPRELGLWSRNIPSSLFAALFLWALLQSAMLVTCFLSEGYIRFTDQWEGWAPLRAVLTLAVFALTKAFYDETIYRGLLLPQLHVKLQKYVPLSSGWNLILAVLLSQLLYILIQVPLIDFGEGNEFHLTSALLSIFSLSILNALVFLRTKNLYIAIGVHALWYATVLFADTDFPPTIALASLVIVLIVIWPMLPDRRAVLYAQPLEDHSLY